MSSQHGLTDRVNQMWASVRTRWSGPPADAFYRQYILKMQETTDRFEQECSRLEEINQQFAEGLSAIEAKTLY